MKIGYVHTSTATEAIKQLDMRRGQKQINGLRPRVFPGCIFDGTKAKPYFLAFQEKSDKIFYIVRI